MMLRRIHPYIWIFLVLLPSCVPTVQQIKSEQVIEDEIPEHYPDVEQSKSDISEEQSVSIDRDKQMADTVSWEDFFSDSTLRTLIRLGLRYNQELSIVQQEALIAQYEAMGTRGEYQPMVEVGTISELEKVGGFTSQGASDATSEYAPGKTVPEVLHINQIGLAASWEVDIWKRLRHASRSAFMKYLASREGVSLLQTQLISEIASSYYELLALDQELLIVTNYIEILDRAHELVRLQQQAARVTALAVKRFEAEVLKNKGRRFQIEQEITQTENRINLLLGRFPQPIERNHGELGDIVPKIAATGIPADLLDNRPDVRQAKQLLESSKLDVKSAKARFYPGLRIQAGASYEAFNLTHFLKTPESLFYHLGADLVAPILNRKAIKADYYSANTRQQQAVFVYEQAILRAYTEVVNQLSWVNRLQSIYDVKSKQVDALKASSEISLVMFKAARVDYVESLMTQRETLEAKVELVELQKDRLLAAVKLYRALGGGWQKQAVSQEPSIAH